MRVQAPGSSSLTAGMRSNTPRRAPEATDDFYPRPSSRHGTHLRVNWLAGVSSNRLMSRKRESFTSYPHALGIDSDAVDTPMELLAWTGGPRATDTFHPSMT